jgi:hypothetical protein
MQFGDTADSKSALRGAVSVTRRLGNIRATALMEML